MSSVNVGIVIYLALTLLIEGVSEWCLTRVCLCQTQIPNTHNTIQYNTIQLHMLEFRLNLTQPYKTGRLVR